MSVHLGWGYNNVRAAYDEVSEKIQSEVYENAKAFAKENKDRYDCGGYIYVGEVLQQIDSTNGTTYLKDILDHAKLTERHKKLIEQQTTSTEEVITETEE